MSRAKHPPRTPEEHHAEALALLNDAQDYPANSGAAIYLVTRAAAHASLALYKPTTRRKTTAKE